MNFPNILLIDDDPDMFELVKSTCGSWPRVLWAHNVDEGIDLWKNNEIDLLLLDLDINGKNGYDVLAKLRDSKKNLQANIFILTGDQTIDSELKGRELGVDEYIKKPFNSKLMDILMHKHLVNKGPIIGDDLIDGPVNLKKSNLTLTVIDDVGLFKVALSAKEYKIIYLLMKNKGHVFSREQIFNEVWDTENESLLRNVDIHISNIRKKLGPHKIYFKTVRNLGYCFDS